MVLGAFLFASMGVCIKFASARFATFEIVAYRGLIGMLLLLGMAGVRRVPLGTTVPWMHAWRGLVGAIALLSWFYAIGELPLATSMTLNYMSSLWIAVFVLLGALWRRAPNGHNVRRQLPLFLTVLTGFAGVALMLRPTVDSKQSLGALSGLLSGVFAAMAYLQVSALARVGEPETRTVFYFSLGATLTGFVGLWLTGGTLWHTWSTEAWPHALWLIPVGLLAAGGQLCMTRAYASGGTLLVANLQYAGIVFASIYSMAIFGDQLPLIGWLGMALIVGSGIVATQLRAGH